MIQFRGSLDPPMRGNVARLPLKKSHPPKGSLKSCKNRRGMRARLPSAALIDLTLSTPWDDPSVVFRGVRGESEVLTMFRARRRGSHSPRARTFSATLGPKRARRIEKLVGFPNTTKRLLPTDLSHFSPRQSYLRIILTDGLSHTPRPFSPYPSRPKFFYSLYT